MREKLEGTLVDASEYRENLMRALVLIRKGVESIRRSLGNDAVKLLGQVLDQVEKTLFGGNSNGDADSRGTGL